MGWPGSHPAGKRFESLLGNWGGGYRISALLKFMIERLGVSGVAV